MIINDRLVIFYIEVKNMLKRSFEKGDIVDIVSFNNTLMYGER